jgi:aspartyl-tRNA(Asn)/glutamyl-tRNA(Gln) amidotransferase subunit C
MQITDEIIEKIAGLARLKFDDTEKIQIKNDLQNMLGFIEKMDELNTDDVKPILHMTQNVNSYRKDIIENSINNKTAMQNAKQKKVPHFIVPTVIKK